MQTLKVGELYNPAIRRWPESAQYNYRGGAHELLLCYPALRPAEITAITRRPASFGVLAIPPVIFLLYRFSGDAEWSDCPYSWHLVQAQSPDEATIPSPLEEQERVLLSTVLVSAEDGIVRGLRVSSLSIAVSRALHQAITAQIREPFDPATYDAALKRIYATTPVRELARRAATCEIA